MNLCIWEVDNIQYFLCSRSASQATSVTHSCLLALKNNMQHQQSYYPALWTVLLLYVYFSIQFLLSTCFVPFLLFLSHLCPFVYSFFLSLRLLVKRCSFLLVVIKSYFSSIRELVFERSFWCQRGSIPPVLDVPLMPSFCFPCLPTMPLLMHQPITPLWHCGPQNVFFVCVKVPSLGRKRGGQRHNKWGDCWRMCQRWKEVYLVTVIAMCCLSDVQTLDVSGLNLGPCRWIQLCRSSGFVVLLQKNVGPLINGL